MDRGNGNSKWLYILLVVVVALSAYGLGAATFYATGQGKSSAQNNGNSVATSATPPSGQNHELGPQDTPVPSTDQTARNEVDQVLRLIQQESYFRPVDQKKLWYGAATGMAHSVGDDYTLFLTPPQTQSIEAELRGENFEGVGIYVEMRDGRLTIVGPIPNTPAARAGLRARDVIALVDGRDITGLALDQVVSLIRGPAGSKVRLTIVRGDQPPFEVELIRASIDTPACSTDNRADGVVVISCSIFGDKTMRDLDAGLKQAIDSNAKGVVLDLRNNGGGLVDVAERMLGRFIPSSKGPAFYAAHRQGDPNPEPNPIIDPSSGDPKWYDKPLVVLVNGGSASASEIVSGALKDYGRAKLIGEQTFGKGSEQFVHTLQDGASIRVTVAHWLTPNKKDINPKPTPTIAPNSTPPPLPTFTPTPQVTVSAPDATATAGAQPLPLIPVREDRGLTPDIVVVRTEKDYDQGTDPQLDRAVEYVKSGK